MSKNLIYAAAAAVVLLSSCTTVKDTAYTVTPEAMVVNMTVADIEVSPKQVTATSEWNWNPFRTIKDHKKNAEAIALRETGADVLVEPTYEVVKRGLFRGGRVTVTGHAGKYVNFRNMTEKDAEVIATLSGKLAVGTPIVHTTAPSLVDRLKPKKKFKLPEIEKPKALEYNKGEDDTKSFATLTLGGTWGDEDEVDGGAFTLGFMYGQYGRKWGWYSKLDVKFGEVKRYEYGYGDFVGKESRHGFGLTAGAVKTLGRHFNLLFGGGVGMNMCESGRFAVPVEIGIQWNFGKVNLNFGIQEAFNCQYFAQSETGFSFGLGWNF